MSKDVNLLSYWFPILRGLKEFKEIAKAEEPELKLLLDELERLFGNAFIETADEYGISRFEKIMGITPLGDDTLEDRRFKVQVKWNETSRYTLETLDSQIKVICGEGGYSIKMDYAKYSLTVKVSLSNSKNIVIIQELLDKVVPANIITAVSSFNTHIGLSHLTHDYLSNYTHTEVRETLF